MPAVVHNLDFRQRILNLLSKNKFLEKKGFFSSIVGIFYTLIKQGYRYIPPF